MKVEVHWNVGADLPEEAGVNSVKNRSKEEDVARGLHNGAVAYLKKPFQREDLLKIVNRIESKPAGA